MRLIYLPTVILANAAATLYTLALWGLLEGITLTQAGKLARGIMHTATQAMLNAERSALEHHHQDEEDEQP